MDIMTELMNLLSGFQTIGKAVESMIAYLLTAVIPLNLSPSIISLITLASMIGLIFGGVRLVIKHIGIAIAVAIVVAIFIYMVPLPSDVMST